MPPVGARTPILKPWRLKRSSYFLNCRRYQSSSGIFYDYCLMGPDGKRRKLQFRGPRKALSCNFPKRARGAERLDVHRVFAFNDKRCNGRGLPWSQSRHVHHHPKQRRRPWSWLFFLPETTSVGTSSIQMCRVAKARLLLCNRQGTCQSVS